MPTASRMSHRQSLKWRKKTRICLSLVAGWHVQRTFLRSYKQTSTGRWCKVAQGEHGSVQWPLWHCFPLGSYASVCDPTGTSCWDVPVGRFLTIYNQHDNNNWETALHRNCLCLRSSESVCLHLYQIPLNHVTIPAPKLRPAGAEFSQMHAIEITPGTKEHPARHREVNHIPKQAHWGLRWHENQDTPVFMLERPCAVYEYGALWVYCIVIILYVFSKQVLICYHNHNVIPGLRKFEYIEHTTVNHVNILPHNIYFSFNFSSYTRDEDFFPRFLLAQIRVHLLCNHTEDKNSSNQPLNAPNQYDIPAHGSIFDHYCSCRVYFMKLSNEYWC